MKKLVLLLVFAAAATFSSCSVTLSGASIPADMKTANVLFFENNATLVVPTMAANLTETLKNLIRNQSSLNITTNNPDVVFSGSILSYDIRPTSTIDANNRGVAPASTNRMTLRVNVKYTDNLNPKLSFEEPIERFVDFPTAGINFTQQEPELNRKVIDLVTQDIYKRAFANW